MAEAIAYLVPLSNRLIVSLSDWLAQEHSVTGGDVGAIGFGESGVAGGSEFLQKFIVADVAFWLDEEHGRAGLQDGCGFAEEECR